MKKKNFKLAPDEIRSLVPGCGGCIASDLVTVEGRSVGMMYRLLPVAPEDSGWTFLAGTETPEYLDDTENLSIYDVNTIANLDPDVITLLHHPPGSAFERDEHGTFVAIEGPPVDAPKTSAPAHPFVYREHAMTAEWSITLPLPFKRRIEDEDLVLWRRGFTIFVGAYGNDDGESRTERLEWLKGSISSGAFDFVHESTPTLERLAYRLAEPSEDNRRPAFYAFVVADVGHVNLAMYFDAEQDAAMAHELWRSVALRR